jgi:hypothetical protein
MLNKYNIDRNKNRFNKNRRKDKLLKVFDWIVAAKIIKENNIQNASIGLDVAAEETIVILKDGKPIMINDFVILSRHSNPVLINDDNGEMINCFVSIIHKEPIEQNSLQPLKVCDERRLSNWPRKAIDIIKGSYYYKNINENKFSQVFLISPILYSIKLLECGI